MLLRTLMMRSRRSAVTRRPEPLARSPFLCVFLAGIAWALLVSSAAAAQITVMTSGGFTAPLLEVVPAFERLTGHTVVTVFGASSGGAPDSIPARLARGEPADIVILTADALAQLAARGHVDAATRVDLVRSRIGMAVKAGAPKPDISSVEAFVKTLLRAQSIAYSASASGTYLSTDLFPRLGIASQLAGKSRRIVSERVGAVVARGEAEIGFQQMSELLPIEGVDIVGPIPDEVQLVSIFAAAITTKARQPDAARALVDYLASPAAVPAILEFGLDPVTAFSKPTTAESQQLFEQLRIMAPAAPGGGWDQTARVMQQVLQQAGLVGVAPVENIPGAAGTIGLSRFIGAERGEGDTLMVSGLIMLGGIVTHRSPVTLGDVTQIARLTGEYEAIVVPAESPFRTLNDLIVALRQRPDAISWGGGSAGGSDQILAGLIAEAIGLLPSRINYVAFSGGGEALAAIVGGQVSLGVNGLAEVAAHVDAGTLRALAISSAERLPGLSIPTLREQDVDVVLENWRSVVAPPGIDTDQRRRLEELIARMVRSPEWREALERYRWLDRYLSGREFETFVSTEESRVRDVLRKLGHDERTASRAPEIYPMFVFAGLLATGAGALLQIRRRPGAEPRRTREWQPIALVITGIVMNVALAHVAGFVIASAALFWCTARAFDATHPFRDGVVAIAIAIAAFLLFAHVLQLPLPGGMLATWL